MTEQGTLAFDLSAEAYRDRDPGSVRNETVRLRSDPAVVRFQGEAADEDGPEEFDGETRTGIRSLPVPSAEPESANDRTGLPRPMVTPWSPGDESPGRKLPVPWINGAGGLEGDFYSFRNDMLRALTERRCCICGDQLHRLVAIAAANGRSETSAGWGHPRCVNLAVALCPHFTSDRALGWETVAWLYEGPGTGVSDPAFGDMDPIDQPATAIGRAALAELAASDPWGERGTGPHTLA